MPRTKPIVDFLKDLSPLGSSDESSEESVRMPEFVRKPKWRPVPRTSLGDVRIRRSVFERNFAPKEPLAPLPNNSTPNRSVRKSFGHKTILSLSPIVLQNYKAKPPNETPNKSLNRTPKNAPEDAQKQIEQPPVQAGDSFLAQVAAKRTSSSLDNSADQYYIPKKKNIADTLADEFADNSDNGTPLKKRQVKKRHRHRSRAATHSTRTPLRLTTIVQKVRDMGTEVTDSLTKGDRPKAPPKFVPPKFVANSNRQAEFVSSIQDKTRSNDSETSLTSDLSGRCEDVRMKHISIQCEQDDTLIEDADQNEQTITPDPTTNLNKIGGRLDQNQLKQKTTREEETQKKPKGKVNIISVHTIAPPDPFYSHGRDVHLVSNGSRSGQNSKKRSVEGLTDIASTLETTLEARRKLNLDAQTSFLRGLDHGKGFRLSKSAHAENEEDDNDVIEDYCASMKVKEVLNQSKHEKNRSKLNNAREDPVQNRMVNEDYSMGANTKRSGQKTGGQGKTGETQATSFHDVDVLGNADIGDFDSSTRRNCNGVKPKKTGRKEGPEEGPREVRKEVPKEAPKEAPKEGPISGNKNTTRGALHIVSDDSNCSDEIFEPPASPSNKRKGHTSNCHALTDKKKGLTSKGHKAIRSETANEESLNASKAKNSAPKEGPKTVNKNNTRDARRIASDDSDDSDEESEVRASASKQKGLKSVHHQPPNEEPFKRAKITKAGAKVGDQERIREAQKGGFDDSDNSDDDTEVLVSPTKKRGRPFKTHKHSPNKTANKDVSKSQKAGRTDVIEDQASSRKKAKGQKGVQNRTTNEEEGLHFNGDQIDTAEDQECIFVDLANSDEVAEHRASPTKQKGQASKGHKAIRSETANEESFNASKTKKSAPKEGPKTVNKNNTRDARRIASDDSDDSDEEFEVRASASKHKGVKSVQHQPSNEEPFKGAKITKVGAKTGDQERIREAQKRGFDDSDNSDDEVLVSPTKKRGRPFKVHRHGQNETANTEVSKTPKAGRTDVIQDQASSRKKAKRQKGVQYRTTNEENGLHFNGDQIDTAEDQEYICHDLANSDEVVEHRASPNKQKGHASKGHKVIRSETANEETFNASKTKKSAPKEGPKTVNKNNTRDARRIASDDSDDSDEEFEVRASASKHKGLKSVQHQPSNEELFKGAKITKAGAKAGGQEHIREAQKGGFDDSDNSDGDTEVLVSPTKKRGRPFKAHKHGQNETANTEVSKTQKAGRTDVIEDQASSRKKAKGQKGVQNRTTNEENGLHFNGDQIDTAEDQEYSFDDLANSDEVAEHRASPTKQKGHASKGHKAIRSETANEETFNAPKTKKSAPKEGPKIVNKNNTRDARGIASDDSDDSDEEFEVRASASKQKGLKSVHHQPPNEEPFKGAKITKAGAKAGGQEHIREAQKGGFDDSDNSDDHTEVLVSPTKKRGRPFKAHKHGQNETANTEVSKTQKAGRTDVIEDQASARKKAKGQKGVQNRTTNEENGWHFNGNQIDTAEDQEYICDDLANSDEVTEHRASPTKQKGHASKGHKAIRSETANAETFNAPKTKKSAPKEGPKIVNKNNTRDARGIASDDSDDSDEEFEVRASASKQKGLKSVHHQPPNEEPFKGAKITKAGAKAGGQEHIREAQKGGFDDSDNSDDHTEVLVSPTKKRGRPFKAHKHGQNETANTEVSKTQKAGRTDVIEDQASARKKAKGQKGVQNRTTNEENGLHFNGDQIDTAEDQEYSFDDLANCDEVTEHRASPTKQKGQASEGRKAIRSETANEEIFNAPKTKKSAPKEGPKIVNKNSTRDAANALKDDKRRSLFDDFLVPAIPVQKGSHKGKRKRTIDDRRKRSNGDDLGSTDEDGHRLTESRIITSRSDDDDFSDDEGVSPSKKLKASEKEASQSKMTSNGKPEDRKHGKSGKDAMVSEKHTKKDEGHKVKKPRGRPRGRPPKLPKRVESPKLSADDGYSSETTPNAVGTLDVRRSGRARTATKFQASYTIYGCDSTSRLARHYGKLDYCAAPVDSSYLSYTNNQSGMKTKTKKTTDRTPEEDEEADPTEIPSAKKRGRKKKNETSSKELRDEVSKAKRGKKATKMSVVIAEDVEIDDNDENLSIDPNVVPLKSGEASGSSKKTIEKKSAKATGVKSKKEKEIPKVKGRAPGRKKVVAESLERDDDRLPQEEVRGGVSEEPTVLEDVGGRNLVETSRCVATHDICEADPRISDAGSSRSSSLGSNGSGNTIEFPVNGVVETITLCTSDEIVWDNMEGGNSVMSMAQGLSLRYNQTGNLILGVGGHKASQILRKSDMFIFVYKGTGKFSVHTKVMIKSVGQTIVVPLGARYSITNISDDEDLALTFFNSRYDLA